MATYTRILKEIELFDSDSKAIQESTCGYTPFCCILFREWNTASSTSCSARILGMCLFNSDGPKLSCYSLVIIVKNTDATTTPVYTAYHRVLSTTILISKMCIFTWSQCPFALTAVLSHSHPCPRCLAVVCGGL